MFSLILYQHRETAVTTKTNNRKHIIVNQLINRLRTLQMFFCCSLSLLSLFQFQRINQIMYLKHFGLFYVSPVLKLISLEAFLYIDEKQKNCFNSSHDRKKLILKARHTTKVHWKIVLTHKFLSLESLLSSLGCFPKHSTALNLKTAIVVAYRDDGSC